VGVKRQWYGFVLLVTFLLQRNLCRNYIIIIIIIIIVSSNVYILHDIIFCSVGLIFRFYMKVVGSYKIFFEFSRNPSATTRRMSPCFIPYKYTKLLSMLWAILFVFVQYSCMYTKSGMFLLRCNEHVGFFWHGSLGQKILLQSSQHVAVRHILIRKFGKIS
jgi:hypothetical protein